MTIGPKALSHLTPKNQVCYDNGHEVKVHLKVVGLNENQNYTT